MKRHKNGAEIKHPKSKEESHNTALTSLEAFTDYTASGKRQTEAIQALLALSEHQPITSRRLSDLMKIERCHITRILKDLEGMGKVRVSHIAPCQVTGKRVQHYCLINWLPSLFPSHD